MINIATVTASFGNNYTIYFDNLYLPATFKGKTNRAVVGDEVEIQITATQDNLPTQASINKILPRKNLLYRSDNAKSKAFASNIDKVFLIVACEPSFNTALIDRAIVACQVENIDFCIILNKCDLIDKVDYALEKLQIYKELGYELHCISSKNQQQIDEVFNPIKEQKLKCILMGQSGMGKSSIINKFLGIDLSTREISTKLDSGKHTTTHTKIYPFTENIYNGYLIDSPGFQLFGLNHLSTTQLMFNFKEFIPYLNKCKFSNCIHRYEPQCAVLEAVEQGKILDSRVNSYYEILDENSVKKW